MRLLLYVSGEKSFEAKLPWRANDDAEELHTAILDGGVGPNSFLPVVNPPDGSIHLAHVYMVRLEK